MDQYLNILNMISKKQLPESFDVGSKELDIILNIIDEELISANLQPVYGSTFVNSPRLTIKGEEKLKALNDPQSNHSSNHSAYNNWYQKPIGITGIGVFIGVLVAMAIYLIKRHLGLLLF